MNTLNKIWRTLFPITFENLIEDHGKWADSTFPNGTAIGALLHAHREIDEIISDIEDGVSSPTLSIEYADALFCIMDSARRMSISVEEILEAGKEKLSVNKNRKWKDNGDGSYNHIKGKIGRNINAPLTIQILSITAKSVLKSEGNLADGHLEKFNFTKGCRNDHSFNQQIVEPCMSDGYSRIWIHIKDDWFKEIGKYQDSKWSCQ